MADGILSIFNKLTAKLHDPGYPHSSLPSARGGGPGAATRLGLGHSIVRVPGQPAEEALISFRYHSLKERVCDSIGPYGPGR
jgi:hypothetical protein